MATRRVTGDGNIPDRPTNVLVIDVGGTNVKLLLTGQREPRRIASGLKMTGKRMVDAVKSATLDWNYDVIAMGYPGPVSNGRGLGGDTPKPAASPTAPATANSALIELTSSVSRVKVMKTFGGPWRSICR